jgi:ABC-type dipeptide/oligopeptide/nickel transport system permease subunit
LGGKVDLLLMRVMDLMLALPSLLLAVVIVSILGPDLWNGVIAIGLVNIPTFARIARSGVLSELEKEYVAADRVIGRRAHKILLFGIVPNMVGPLIVVVTLSFGSAVLDAAGLSFLGLGAQPPSPEWGALIAEGRNYVFHAPWLIWFPGIAILVTVVAFNLLGDSLRDLMAPDEDTSRPS